MQMENDIHVVEEKLKDNAIENRSQLAVHFKKSTNRRLYASHVSEIDHAPLSDFNVICPIIISSANFLENWSLPSYIQYQMKPYFSHFHHTLTKFPLENDEDLLDKPQFTRTVGLRKKLIARVSCSMNLNNGEKRDSTDIERRMELFRPEDLPLEGCEVSVITESVLLDEEDFGAKTKNSVVSEPDIEGTKDENESMIFDNEMKGDHVKEEHVIKENIGDESNICSNEQAESTRPCSPTACVKPDMVTTTSTRRRRSLLADLGLDSPPDILIEGRRRSCRAVSKPTIFEHVPVPTRKRGRTKKTIFKVCFNAPPITLKSAMKNSNRNSTSKKNVNYSSFSTVYLVPPLNDWTGNEPRLPEDTPQPAGGRISSTELQLTPNSRKRLAEDVNGSADIFFNISHIFGDENEGPVTDTLTYEELFDGGEAVRSRIGMPFVSQTSSTDADTSSTLSNS